MHDAQLHNTIRRDGKSLCFLNHKSGSSTSLEERLGVRVGRGDNSWHMEREIAPGGSCKDASNTLRQSPSTGLTQHIQHDLLVSRDNPHP